MGKKDPDLQDRADATKRTLARRVADATTYAAGVVIDKFKPHSHHYGPGWGGPHDEAPTPSDRNSISNFGPKFF